MSVLVITHSGDSLVPPRVIHAIEERGHRAVRFDTDRFPTDVQLCLDLGGSGQRLVLCLEDGQEVDLTEVSAIWFRRFAAGKGIPARLGDPLRLACRREARAMVCGLIASLEAFQLDLLPRLRRAQNKQLQLRQARRLGFEIPRTIITNQPHEVLAFARSCQGGIVAKTLTSFAMTDGEGREQGVFTSRITPEDLAQLDGLRHSPMIFQEEIPKALDLRVTVVGHRVFAAAVDSQAREETRVDWRRGDSVLLGSWEPYSLSSGLEERVLALLDAFGLNFATIDFIVTPTERHVFLEVNPAGEYAWLEDHPGLPISQSIADLLVGTTPRRAMPGFF